MSLQDLVSEIKQMVVQYKQPPKDRVQKPPTPGTFYSIHQRSLPVKEDRRVIINIESLPAAQWEQRRLCWLNAYGEPQAKPYLWEDIDGDIVTTYSKGKQLKPVGWHYYDIVPQDGVAHNVFENRDQILKNDDSEEVSKDYEPVEIDWKE